MFQNETASCSQVWKSAGLHDLERVPGWLDSAIEPNMFALGLEVRWGLPVWVSALQ